MSAELFSLNVPGGNHGSPQGDTIGGSKPLHRFLKRQPKIIGIVILILGASSIAVIIAVMTGQHSMDIWRAIPPSILLGVMFIISGILYILTEHKPSKKTVTISLALSVVSLLGVCWYVPHGIIEIAQYHAYRGIQYSEDNVTEREEVWSLYNDDMTVTLEIVFVLCSLVGGIIFVIMSVFAGLALRSTKAQAIVVMTATPVETPVE